MNLDITEIIVLEREHGMDKVIIKTDNLPATVYPYDEKGVLTMDIRKGFGAQYVRDNFNIEPKVICV